MRERAAALEEANQKLAEEKIMLERMRTTMRLSQKLEAVGQLAAGVANEIYTPLQYVEGNLNFLKGSFNDVGALLLRYREALNGSPPEDRRLRELRQDSQGDGLDRMLKETRVAFEQAQEGVQRVADIINAVNEFVSSEQSGKIPADINRALSNTLSITRNEYRHFAEIETDFGEIPLVPCFIGDLNQAFLNIIINAAHAIDEKQRVAGKRQRGKIRITTCCDADTVEICIEDTGCGIADDIKGRIFEPFFTTKQAGRGTGQGLAIAHHVLVVQHGGKVRVESRVDEGTRFVIRLPRNPADVKEHELLRHDKITGIRRQ
jgi:signal transduction histidine kinase